MNFEQGNQNGIQPVTELKSLESLFAVAVSNTYTYEGATVICKAISNAAMYKTVPVNFYSHRTAPNGSTSTDFIGTATWNSTNTAVLVTEHIGTGTNQIYAVWEGEGKFAGQTTEFNPVDVEIVPGRALGGTMTISGNPTIGTITEPVTFTLTASTSTNITGTYAVLYSDNIAVGRIKMVGNSGSTQTTFTSTGSYSVRAQWEGAYIGGTYYRGTTSNTLAYNVAYQPLTTGFTVSSNLSPNTVKLPTTFTATLSTSTTCSGIITFNKNGVSMGTATIVNNVATLVKPANFFTAGTYNIVANWDGGGTYRPRSSSSFSQVMANPTNTSMTINPSTSTYEAYAPNGDISPSLPYVTVVLSSLNASHLPVGTLTLKDVGTNTTLATTNITSTGTYILSWNPIDAGHVDTDRTLRVDFSGDEWNNASSSPTTVISIKRSIPTITLSSSPNPIRRFSNSSLYANSGAFNLTGAVTFKEGTSTIGTSTFSSGVATQAIIQPTVGTHTYTANYPGDSKHEATTATGTLVVNRYINTASITSLEPLLTGVSVYAQPAVLAGDPTSFNVTVTPYEYMASNTLTVRRGTTATGFTNIGTVDIVNGTGQFTWTSSLQFPTAYATTPNPEPQFISVYSAGNPDFEPIVTNYQVVNVAQIQDSKPTISGGGIYSRETQSLVGFNGAYVVSNSIILATVDFTGYNKNLVSTGVISIVDNATSNVVESATADKARSFGKNGGLDNSLLFKTGNGPYTYSATYSGDKFNRSGATTSTISFTVYDYYKTLGSLNYNGYPSNGTWYGNYPQWFATTTKKSNGAQTYSHRLTLNSHRRAPWGVSSSSGTTDFSVPDPTYGSLPNNIWTIPTITLVNNGLGIPTPNASLYGMSQNSALSGRFTLKLNSLVRTATGLPYSDVEIGSKIFILILKKYGTTWDFVTSHRNMLYEIFGPNGANYTTPQIRQYWDQISVTPGQTLDIAWSDNGVRNDGTYCAVIWTQTTAGFVSENPEITANYENCGFSFNQV